jgi:hypothetical protein
VASCSNFRQNSDELLGVEVALVGGKSECALRGDRGDEVDRVAGTGGGHDRGVPDRCPGGAGVVIRAQVRLRGIEPRVEARIARQSLLKRREPSRCLFFCIHEYALRLPVGGGEVMRHQIWHLLMAGSRRCAIRAFPVTAGATRAWLGRSSCWSSPNTIRLCTWKMRRRVCSWRKRSTSRATERCSADSPKSPQRRRVRFLRFSAHHGAVVSLARFQVFRRS